jgi:hypothetical protein
LKVNSKIKNGNQIKFKKQHDYFKGSAQATTPSRRTFSLSRYNSAFIQPARTWNPAEPPVKKKKKIEKLKLEIEPLLSSNCA